MSNSKSISCPNCKTSFPINENDHAHILSQVKEQEIEQVVKKRLDLAKIEKENAITIAKEQTKSEMQKLITAGEKEIESLKSEKRLLQEQEKVSVQSAISEKEKQIEALSTELKNSKASQEALIKKLGISKELEVEKTKSEMQKKINDLNIQIESLKLKNMSQNNEHNLKVKSLEDKHKLVVNDLTSEIERRKNMQSKLSTKMVGETLEQHCQMEFDSIRADAYRNAVFKKDTNPKNGTMGDLIFRNFSEDKIEFVSAMIDCKNETESDSKKKKISDFFKKLDKDRNDKGCIFAICVTTCEPNNDFYNRGIVEVLDYKDMYVCRPTFFLPMLSLLNNFGMKTLEEKRELQVMRSQSLDLIDFEENLETFKKAFEVNFERASENFAKAIEQITKIIDQLEKAKTFLMKVQDNFRIANGKAQKITIKRLTAGNPFMERVFKIVQEEKNDNQQ